MDICICTTDSLCCTPETNTALKINFMPIKLKKKKKPFHIMTKTLQWYIRLSLAFGKRPWLLWNIFFKISWSIFLYLMPIAVSALLIWKLITWFHTIAGKHEHTGNSMEAGYESVEWKMETSQTVNYFHAVHQKSSLMFSVDIVRI